MGTPGRFPARNFLKKLVLCQAVMTLAAAFFLLPFNEKFAYSALLGGSICVIINGVFMWKLLGKSQVMPPGDVLKAFYGGEVVKFVSAGLLFFLVIKLVAVSGPVFLLSFFVIYLSSLWGALLLSSGVFGVKT